MWEAILLPAMFAHQLNGEKDTRDNKIIIYYT